MTDPEKEVDARIESQENWTPAQNGRLDRVERRDGEKFFFWLSSLPQPRAPRLLRSLFLSRALKNREAVNSFYIITKTMRAL